LKRSGKNIKVGAMGKMGMEKIVRPGRERSQGKIRVGKLKGQEGKKN